MQDEVLLVAPDQFANSEKSRTETNRSHQGDRRSSTKIKILGGWGETDETIGH